MPARRSEPLPEGSIAARLAYLMDIAHPPDRGPYLPDEVAEMTQRTAHPLTASYVRQLRLGSRTNPTVDSLRVLAEVFGVPITFFFDERDQATLEADIDLAKALTAVDAESLTSSTAALSPASKKALAEIIRQLQAVQEASGASEPRPGGVEEAG